MSTSPCVSCGACCAHFRVSFFWGETAFSGGTVPDHLVETVNPSLVAMKGTCEPKPRCESLDGVIGETVGCAIYEQRSTPCRDFDASWAYGEHDPRCDTARAAHGLRPLTPDDHITTLIAVQDITQHTLGA